MGLVFLLLRDSQKTDCLLGNKNSKPKHVFEQSFGVAKASWAPRKRKARVSGVCALCRHDGTEWPRPASGTALRKKGVLLGIRETGISSITQLSLPSWSSTRLCCWCEMEKDNLGRNESPPVLTSDQFFSWCLECGTDVAPFFPSLEYPLEQSWSIGFTVLS